MKMKLNQFIVLAIISAGLLLNSCSTSAPPPQLTSRTVANSQLESILEEFKTSYENSLSAERKAEIRTVQENLLKYLIEATHSDSSYKVKKVKEAEVYFNKMYPVLLQNIHNEKEGVKSFAPVVKAPLWTLKDEIAYLNKETKNLPKPKVQIDLVEGLKMLAPFYKNLNDENKAMAHAKYDEAAAKLLGDKLDLQPNYKELEAILDFNGSDEERIVKMVGIVESKLQKHENAIRTIGTEIAKSGQVDLKNPQIRMVVKFMDYYFTKLPDDVIKTIMSELVTGGPKFTEETVLKVIFQNTGPGLGKVLQQIGKEKGMGEKFSVLMGILESTGKPVPIHLVKNVVETDVGGFEIKGIVEKPLGTGTIAQVNKAVLTDEGVEREVALRFLKPGVANRCKEDIALLRKFVPENEEMLKAEGFQDMKVFSTLIDSVEKFLDEEVDLSIAVERQKMANELYTRTVKVSANPNFKMLEMKVPSVYMPPKGKSNLHVQEFATGGVKFNDLTDNAAKKIVAQEMLRMWFEEALFRSGFLNADLHQGNFRVVLVEEDKQIKILLYDFGLSSTLTKEDQRAFILVGAGAFLSSPDTIADGLMASMNSTDKTLKAKLIKDIQQEMKANPKKPAEAWVAWCVQKNYFVSDKLGAFARGSLLLKQLPESIGEGQMFKDVITKSAVSNLVHSIADREYNFPLTKIDMIKLGYQQVKSSCFNMIKSFFK
jgi:predicted unusual protein kinase regulating ubiquinone biosynthesis (AarF/ABC1/UbiB family)